MQEPVVSADDDHDDEEDAGDGDRDKEDNEGRHTSTSYVQKILFFFENQNYP